VFIEPQTRIVGQNLTCTLKIKIANVESTNKLHGYELKIYYNKTLLDPVSATQGTFLNSTASTNFSAYLNDSYNATHGQIWLICLQNVPNSPGVFGDGTLAEITFIAAIDAKGTTAVSIVSNLATVAFLPAANDVVATAISHTATNGLIKVTIRGDVDGDGNVTIFDVVRITRIYNVPSTDPRYDPDADLNNNGLIEIFDVVLCTSNYGKKDP